MELMSHLSVGRSSAACAIFDNAFWIVGGTESGATSMHTVESFDLRCATTFVKVKNGISFVKSENRGIFFMYLTNLRPCHKPESNE